MKKIVKAFDEVRTLVLLRFPRLTSTEVLLGCPRANREHRNSSRQYMHVFHHPGCICVASAAVDLPLKNLRGLFYHEFGHLIVGKSGTEFDADMVIWEYLGIPIRYAGKKELQEV